MRYTFTLFILLISLVSKGQGISPEISTSYVFSAPRGTMQQNIKNANGVTVDFYLTPKEKRYSFGFEMAYNGYGHDKSTQNYTMDDGSVAPMDIVVNNSFFNMMLAGRYFLMDGTIKPFITGKVGYSFFNTNLSIYDPNDMDQCEPVDGDALSKDATAIFSGGAGVRWDLLPKKCPGLLSINISANYSAGGKVNYMNVDAPSHSHANHTSDVYARFINTQTQVIHEHHVGNVYSTSLEFLDFRIGGTVRLGR
jgi:hypothetical protein